MNRQIKSINSVVGGYGVVGYVVANHPVPVKIEKNQKTSLVKKFHKGHKYIPKTKAFDVAF